MTSATTITPTQTGAAVHRLGLACALSGLLMLVAGGVPAYSAPGVPDDQWSYPQTPGPFLAMSVFLAIGHVLSVGGFVGARRLGAAGGGRVAQIGFTAAIAGLVALAFCEIISGVIADEPLDSSVAKLVGTLFGVSSLVFAVGAIAVGIRIARTGRWPGWGRWLVMATGVVIVVLVTPANVIGDPVFRWVSLALWSCLFVPLGVQVASGLRPHH